MSLPDAASFEGSLVAELRAVVSALVAEIEALRSSTEAQQATISVLRAENQALRYEGARLKGLPPRPPSRPSGMEQATQLGAVGQDAKCPKSPRNVKRDRDAVSSEIVVKAAVPAGSRFKGYEDILVRDLHVSAEVVRYRREHWLLPSDETVVTDLPAGIVGGFGPELRRFVLALHAQGQVTTERLTALLDGIGVGISKRQVVRLLAEPLDGFVAEDQDVLRAGLATARWVTVDDTAARHARKDGFTTQIGDDRVDSIGCRNTLREGIVMSMRKRRSDRCGRLPLSSPGRPPVAGRDERRRFWAAIAAALSSEDAAVGAGVPQAVGTRWFRKAGGMPPAMYGRSAKPLTGRYLSLGEREELAILHAQGDGVREIARQMGRSASNREVRRTSAVSRELRRNAATRSGGLEYRATTAQWHADRSARRPKPAKLAVNAALRVYVQERLAGVVVAPGGGAIPGPVTSWKGRRHGPRQPRRWAAAWSPEQIARRLRLDFPGDGTMRISHEAIYQALYIQSRVVRGASARHRPRASSPRLTSAAFTRSQVFVSAYLARIIHEKCAIKAKSLTSFATMRTGCLMEFFAMKSLAQAFGGLGRFRAI